MTCFTWGSSPFLVELKFRYQDILLVILNGLYIVVSFMISYAISY